MAKGITETDVHQAADALVAAGERPTVERIRAHLGTGSPNTVIRWLDTWWQALGGRLAAQHTRLALPEAPDAVVALVTQCWEQALSSAQEEAARVLSAEREALEAARRDLVAREGAWQGQIQDHAAAAAQARNQLAAAEQRLVDLQRTGDLQGQQIEDLSSQRTALQARADRLETELAAVQRRAEEREASLVSENQRQAEYLRALEERANVEIDRARQETKAVRAELTTRLKGLEAETQAAREREEQGRIALAQAHESAAVQRARADTLERQWQRAVGTSKAPAPRPARAPRKARGGKRPSSR